MDVRATIIECIGKVLKTEDQAVQNLPGNESLRVIGMDSLNCVDIVVGIEQEFGIVFNDEELLMENLNTVDKLVSIVTTKVPG
jgi:acyl carrier protein